MLRAILWKYKFIYIFSVQHLAPVIEAVSDASTDDAASNSMEIHALSTSTNCSGINMFLHLFH